MNRYRDYLDDIHVSKELHQSLIHGTDLPRKTKKHHLRTIVYCLSAVIVITCVYAFINSDIIMNRLFPNNNKQMAKPKVTQSPIPTATTTVTPSVSIEATPKISINPSPVPSIAPTEDIPMNTTTLTTISNPDSIYEDVLFGQYFPRDVIPGYLFVTGSNYTLSEEEGNFLYAQFKRDQLNISITCYSEVLNASETNAQGIKSITQDDLTQDNMMKLSSVVDGVRRYNFYITYETVSIHYCIEGSSPQEVINMVTSCDYYQIDDVTSSPTPIPTVLS